MNMMHHLIVTFINMNNSHSITYKRNNTEALIQSLIKEITHRLIMNLIYHQNKTSKVKKFIL